ncbi:hypothetical protein AN958_07926 [Leucoagaricus sp. SymC.cos]|nr:hypothetical protein AN958_07926 [Leucoagaricus sp. SymC.cos]
MPDIANPSSDPELDSTSPVISEDSISSKEDATASAGQEKQGEEEALESHEVIELQAFSEKKPWIEERIRFLEEMPTIEVFVGLDAIRASAEVVPGLPSRATLEEWLAKHDSVDKETEIFDIAELEKLRQLTKAATHRNLSPADTDVIESTLGTIFALDKLLQLLRERSASLELLGTRLTWEEHRSAAWVERRQVIDDFTQFIMKRARWNTSIYDRPAKDDSPLARRGSVNSFASAGSDSSVNVNSAAFSRSARFKLAELLSRDAAHFGSRVTALRHGNIASAGKILDKLIDISRAPVPEELLDEQDRLEEKGITELEQVGKFAMNLVMQWRKADEIHVETIKDQGTAQNLLEEIETAKLQHPTQRQCNSFMSRADALLKRLSVRVNPVVSPQFFPHPTHPLFEDQPEFNTQLTQLLAAEIQTAIDLANKASISAKQYQSMYEAVKRLDATLGDAMDTSAKFKTYLRQMEIGVSNVDGDGSAPNLSTERCLDTARHGVFLALWPSLSDEITEALKRTDAIIPEMQVSITLFDASNARDPDYRRQALEEVRELQVMKERVEITYRGMLTKLDHLREARRIVSSVENIQQRLLDLRLQVKEVMERTRWRQDSLNSNLPLTPESPPALVEEEAALPPDFAKQLMIIREAIVDEVDTPYTLLSQHLEIPLKEHFAWKFASVKAFVTGTEDMMSMLVALQQQVSAMVSAREECHTLQLRIEDAKIRSTSFVDNVLADSGDQQEQDFVVEFDSEVERIQADVNAFNEGLVFKVPFISRQPPSVSLNSARYRSLSVESVGSLSHAHDAHFDLLSVDTAVRADCNSFTMRLGGEMEGLFKCKHHLALARSSKELDQELVKTTTQIYDVTQGLSSWKSRRDQISKDTQYLDSLNKLLEDVEDQSMISWKSIAQRFSPHREHLRRMEALSTTLDQSIREVLYMVRVRTVDDLELRFNTWSENLASFKRELDQVIRNELFRLDEIKRTEEQRQREEAERKKAEEEQRRREEEEQHLREEAEREEAARLAEETRLQQEKQRLAAMLVEKRRLENERIEAEKRVLAEKQEAEAERLRLEQQYSATMEAQRLLAQRERDELALRLRQLEEELASTRRLQQDQQRTSAEQAAKTALELERQRRELEDLLKEYRDKLNSLKTLENQVHLGQQSQDRTAKAPNMLTIAESQDTFMLEVSPVTPNPRDQAMLELEARIHALRRRLSALGLKDAANSSHNLPTEEQAHCYRHGLTIVSNEAASLPSNVDDGTTSAVLLSFRADLDAALEQMQSFEQLAGLNTHFQNCDGALSDLLEHIDSYPAPPAVTMSSFTPPQLTTPEDQLSARVKFTKDTIDVIDELALPLLADLRVAAEHSRTMQTWNDLFEMANDRITGMKSRPETSSSRSIMRSSRPSRQSPGGGSSGGSTWARAPRNSLSSILPLRAHTPKKERPPRRKKYVPNPKSKLDVAVGDVVNNLPVGINVEGLTETWKDQSGKYWIGNQDPKLCFCRILRSQTVMVRVGGGWQELSKFIKGHFADSFRLLSESPPRVGGLEEKWISSASLLEAAEITSTNTTTAKSPPPAPPRTPEPKLPFVPSFSLLTPGGQSPRSIGSSTSTKGSPLTPLQFMRKAEPDSTTLPTLLRPVTPTKQSRGNNSQAPLRLWRP